MLRHYEVEFGELLKKMAPWEKVLIAKPGNPSSSPRTHSVNEEEN